MIALTVFSEFWSEEDIHTYVCMTYTNLDVFRAIYKFGAQLVFFFKLIF